MCCVFVLLYCASYLLFRGAGFQSMVGRGVPFLFSGFSLGDLRVWGWVFPAWRLSGGYCPALLFGSTLVLEGVL